MSREVVLFSGEIARGTTTHQSVCIDDDGALVLAAQDLGRLPSEIWGHSDYEYWIVVGATDKQEVCARLREELGADPDGRPGADDELVDLMRRKYAGNHGASFDFQRWLDAHGIPYCFDSY